jgi:hypothetical protein
MRSDPYLVPAVAAKQWRLSPSSVPPLDLSWRLSHFHCSCDNKSYRGRSNGVLRRVKRPIECGPSAIACVLGPLVGVPSGTSNTYRSLLLAVSSSTINEPSGYMILKLLLSRSPASFVRTFPIHSTAKEMRIKSRTPRWLVPSVVLRISSLLVIRSWTCQSFGKSGAR